MAALYRPGISVDDHDVHSCETKEGGSNDDEQFRAANHSPDRSGGRNQSGGWLAGGAGRSGVRASGGQSSREANGDGNADDDAWREPGGDARPLITSEHGDPSREVMKVRSADAQISEPTAAQVDGMRNCAHGSEDGDEAQPGPERPCSGRGHVIESIADVTSGLTHDPRRRRAGDRRPRPRFPRSRPADPTVRCGPRWCRRSR